LQPLTGLDAGYGLEHSDILGPVVEQPQQGLRRTGYSATFRPCGDGIRVHAGQKRELTLRQLEPLDDRNGLFSCHASTMIPSAKNVNAIVIFWIA